MRHRAKVQPGPTELDRRFMAAAIALGRRNNGLVRPGPSVGVIVVRKGEDGFEVIARAVTPPRARPHAEILALDIAGDRARGATVYLTIEPAAPLGLASSAAEALVRAGVAHVVSGIEDPDRRFTGRGHDFLRRHGVAVTTGVLAEEAAQLHAGHVSRLRRDRPHVHLALAVSADGGIGREGEGQVAISSPLSKAFALGLRIEHDAILVGVGTVLADDPALNSRLPGLENRSPVRVVVDAAARTPPASAVVQTAARVPTWIFVAPDAPEDRVKALGHKGVLVLVAERDAGGRLDLGDVLFQLGRLGLTSVLCEGGARLARALIEGDFVDEATLVEAPLHLGHGLVPALAGLPLAAITAGPRLASVGRRWIGPDRLTRFFRKD